MKKEEAQSALINNNMDVRLALAELMAGHGANDPTRARLLRCASEDLSHAAASIPPGPQMDIAASLFGQASGPNIRFPPGANANVPGRQQVVVDQLQQQQQQRLLSGLLTSNMPLGHAQSQALQKLMQQQDVQTRAALSAESAQVAALQQHQLQLVQNVHAAVQANLIPPHLLTSTPSMSPSVALKLQRMIQLYELFQKLNVQSQMIASGSAGSQDLISALGSVKQQIVQLQQEVVVALASTSTVPPPPLNLQQPPPSIVPQSNELIRGLPAGMTNDELAAASSKLNQWKQQPSSVTSDPSKQPSSLIQPPNGPLSASNSWPTQSSNATAASQSIDKSAADGSNSNAAAAAAAQLDIEEFVPGKPWQGPSVRSVEDDPFITPGSVTRSAISAVDDAHVMNVLGGKSAAGTIGKQTGAKMGSTVWSNDGMGADARGGQPSHASHPQPPIGRSVSWAAGDRATYGPASVGFPPTSSLRIRNLPPQVDNSFLKALCERYGSLRCFVPCGDQVLLSYVRAEDALQAQQVLSTGTPGGIPPLVIEFVSDADVMRVFEQTTMQVGLGAAVNIPKQAESGWGAPGLGGAFGTGSVGSGNVGSLWSAGLGADDTHGFLPSDLFGGP